MVRLLLAIFLAAAAALAQAQTNSPKVIIEEPGVMDRSYMERQRDKIDKLARTRLGTQVRGNMSDLDLLQGIVDRQLIDSSDTESLQALGVILGEVMVADFRALEWKIYIDSVGRSRALCITGTQHCLFPMTMLSRRMETGLKPDVRKVYEGAIDLVAEHLPHAPYGGGLLRNFPPATNH